MTHRLALAGVIAAAAAVLIASPASAHNFYVSSTPSANEVLTTLPEQFTVTTNDNLLDLGGAGGGFIMQVTGPDGLFYGNGCVTVAGPAVLMDAAVGPAGAYVLNWQVISADGHTISGELPFTWQPGADATAPSTGSATPPVCGETPAVDPTPSENPDEPSPMVTATAGVPNDGADAPGSNDALWIGGAVLASALAVFATVMLLRKRPKSE